MQTFLPYKDFIQSAKCLDNKRLGKQRVEAFQILLALLSIDKNLQPKEKPSHWSNHPATKIWRGYEYSLCIYAMCMCDEWRLRGFNSTVHIKLQKIWTDILLQKEGVNLVIYPTWLDENFCRAHQSNLLRKDYAHYSKYFGTDVPTDLEYIWPVQ